MPEGSLKEKKERVQKLLRRAAATGKLTPEKIENLRPHLKTLGIEPPEPQAEGQLGEMQSQVAEQGAKIDRFKEKVGRGMEEATSAGQGITPERSKVMTFAEPIEVEAGVPEEEQEPLPSMMTVESSIQPPSGRPVDLLPDPTGVEDIPDVEAAPATFYPGEGVEHEAHWHTDPSPDRVKSILQARLEQTDDPQERGFIETQIQDIEKEGEGSVHYENIADSIWNEVRSTFEEHGRPVVRTSQADWLEGDDFAQKWETATTKLAGEYAVPALAGADTALTFGAGKYIAPAVASLVEGDEEKEAAKAELEERGVVPDADERVRQAEAGNPLFSMAGYLRGFTPWGAAGMLSKPITGAMKRFAPEGAKLGRRVAAGAAAGATAAGAERAAERGVQAAGDVAQGQEAPSAAGVGADVALSALMGGGIGTVPPMLLGAGTKMRRGIESPDRAIGKRILKYEDAGGRTRFGRAPKAPPEAEEAVEVARGAQPIRAPSGRNTKLKRMRSAMGLRSRETAEKVVRKVAERERAFKKRAAQQNRQLYAQHSTKQSDPELTSELVDMAMKSGARGDTSAAFARNLDKAVKVRVLGPAEKAPFTPVRVLDWEDVVGTPLEPIAKREWGLPSSASDVLPESKLRVVVGPKAMNAEQWEETVLEPLGDAVYKNRAGTKVGAEQRDKFLRRFDASVRQARGRMFGEKYQRQKARHDDMRRELTRTKAAIGLDRDFEPSKKNVGRALADLDSVVQVMRNLGKEGSEETLDKLRLFWRRNPAVLRELQAQEAMGLHEEMVERARPSGGMATSGPGQMPHSYMTGGFGGFMDVRLTHPAAKGLQKAGRIPSNVAAILGNKYLHRAGDVAAVAERLGIDLGSAAGSALASAARFVEELRQTRDEELE